MDTAIQIENASLRFRTYRNPSPALKEIILNYWHRRNHPDKIFEFDALKNLSLTVNGGDRLGIIGLNGAGKSTLLKMMVGIYRPTSGSITVNGAITPLIELGTGFDLELSGRENIYLNGALLAHSKKEIQEREAHIIEFSELGEFIDLPIKYYSSGMLGRLAFSIATVIEPEILLVDEVFSTGDALFVNKASDRMLGLFGKSKIMILVSHSLAHIETFCNRVIVLHKGQIVNDGPPKEMIEFYNNQIVAQSDRQADSPVCV
jgi:ABC-type polysaccharide/polyol phosphate transport system ATPase subunit